MRILIGSLINEAVNHTSQWNCGYFGLNVHRELCIGEFLLGNVCISLLLEMGRQICAEISVEWFNIKAIAAVITCYQSTVVYCKTDNLMKMENIFDLKIIFHSSIFILPSPISFHNAHKDIIGR